MDHEAAYFKFLCIKRCRKSVVSGCGAVGRAVACNPRGPGFESSHRQLLLNIYLLLTVCRKDENKEKKRSRMAHFFKKKAWYRHSSADLTLFKLTTMHECLFMVMC